MNHPPEPFLPDRRPDFERFRTALARREPDRVPFAELIVEPDVKAAFLGRPIEGLADEVAFWTAAGYDACPIVLSLIKPGRAVGGQVTESYSVYEQHYTERTWAEMHQGVIAGRDDCARYDWPDVERMDFSVLDAAASLLPDGMKLSVTLGKIFTTNWLLQGAESFYLNVHDDPELVEAIYQRLGPLVYATFERVVEHPAVGSIWHPDDLAGTAGLLVSAEHFRRFVFPWYARMGRICRQLDKPMIFHSDGDISSVLDDLVAAGFSGLHPIDPKAMDIVDLKRRYGDRLALIGNIDMDFPLSRGTPEDVAAVVAQRIRDVAPGGGYVLSSGNSVAEYIPLANYQAMLRAGHEHGRYPIV